MNAEPEVAEAIHGQTEGNPLFLTELTRLLARGELSKIQF